MLALALVSALAWAWLVVGHGGFWRADQRLAPAPAPPVWPEVAILIPARDEVATIGLVVRAHLTADYPGACRLVVVDDHSTDGTAEAARRAADEARGGDRLDVIAAPPLPAGWSGKLWALEAGLAHLRRAAPGARWLLLTDADVEVGPELLKRLVAAAEAQGLALLSVMARLDDRGPWGALLIPAFVYFFQMLYPFPWANRPGHPVAAAAGGVMLVRRDALEEVRAFATIRSALIDDCALAARLKRGPPPRAIRIVLADGFADARSHRDNRRFASVRDMVARTAYAQLRHSPSLLLLTLFGLGLVFVVPPLVALGVPLHGSAPAAALGAGAWVAMAASCGPTLKLYGRPGWQGLALPVSAACYAGFTLLSALRHARGRGARWKGRVYPAR
ncbi:MAG: glycosyltransferase [Sphingomonadaceae bacterium]|uniref:glycosyltransferase n=1 Tax=Thermaurantiacus sp. TaxID=2820283 RepID=UPI00298F3749|nr:glycosyltransferase [Thermaurantiacus sp.]MCS6986046.1 glycosyltransferase [Sphingomonadaceae bacterium]MDW8414738.1 glycosyltransferase [Thermaurantiacus sp.]